MFDLLEMASLLGMNSDYSASSASSAPAEAKEKPLTSWLDMSSASAEAKPKEKPLILNPADILVDETLPSPPVTSNVGNLFGKQPTDKEVEAALPLRTAARQTVLDTLTKLLNDEKNYKKYISNEWNSSPPSQQAVFQLGLDNFKLPEYKGLIDYIKSELVWWNTNVKLSATTVNTRAVNFKENLQTKTDIYVRTLRQKIELSSQKLGSQEKEAQSKKAAVMNRTTSDIVWDASMTALSFLGMIIYIVLSLTFASFVANSLLHKPILYRILAFTYAFIFAPIFGVYYTYNRIKYMIGLLNEQDLPLMEGLLPLKPYDLLPNAEPTLIQRIFGYPEEKTYEFRKSQAAKELQSLEKAVENTEMFGKIVEERKKA
jgi:hypothetical protein